MKKPIDWTKEVAAAIDTRSLRIYRADALSSKRTAEDTLAHLTPPEKYTGFIGMFKADLETAEQTIAIIEAELSRREVPFE